MLAAINMQPPRGHDTETMQTPSHPIPNDPNKGDKTLNVTGGSGSLRVVMEKDNENVAD